jgi:hypothetical protein
MKKILFALAATLLPSVALAHGKWLVPNYQSVIDTQHGTYSFYTLSSPEVAVWIAICIFVVFAASVVHRIVPEWRALKRFAERNRRMIDNVAQLVLGTFLVATALFWNVVILPAETVTTPLLEVLRYVQVGIGLMFVFHVAPRYASIGLLILTSVITLSHGLEAVLENVILFSLALYFYLMHTTVHGFWAILKKYSVDMVRIGTGVSLIVLACTEKLLYPELGMQFLAAHPWNFMQPLFPWFSDQLFVLSTGFAEALFGLVFIFGYVTRINTIVIATFFAASVTTMLYQAQVWEVEDFVVYCSAILLLFFSHGYTTLPELLRNILGGRARIRPR